MKVKTCVVCGTQYNLGTGHGHYCSAACYRNTTSKKPPPDSPDDHDSWPDSVGYGGIPICNVPAGVYEAAESNADDWRIFTKLESIRRRRHQSVQQNTSKHTQTPRDKTKQKARLWKFKSGYSVWSWRLLESS